MPVSHSHQLLCVSRSPLSTTVTSGLRRIRDIPDLVRGAAVGPQQVDFILVGAGKLGAVAHTRHLRTARFAIAPRIRRVARNVRQIFRISRIGDVHDGRAVTPSSRSAGSARATVVADIGDPAIALLVDRRLIGAAPRNRYSQPAPCCFSPSFPAAARRQKGKRRWPARRRQRAPRRTRGDAADSDNGIAKGFLSLVPQFGNEIGRDALMGVPL